MSNEKVLASILKSLKAINVSLGTPAGDHLDADIVALNAVVTNIAAAVGTPAGASSIAEQTVLLEAQLE